MPPGQVSRGQGGTGLRFLTRSLTLWRKDKSHVPESNPSSKDNSDSIPSENGSSGSGNKPDGSSNGSSKGGFAGFSSSNTVKPPSPPPLPPCFFPCVSDNDPGVSYSASWSLSPHGFFQTSHQTDVAGSILSFNFTGTGVTVFGSVPPSNATHGPPTAAYSIDGGNPVVTTEALASTTIPNQPLFSTSGLIAGPHSFIINVTNVQSASPFSVDYFIVKPSAPSPTPSASASAIIPEQAITSSTASTNASAATVGILAGMLGAVIFFLLCVVAFFIVVLRRRKQRALRSKSMQSSLFTTSESILRYSRAPSSYYAYPWWNKQPSISGKSQKTMTSYGLNTYGQ